MLADIVENILSSRLWALIVKETREILRNKYLVFLLLVPPTIQLLILGAALDPQVRNLSLGVVDYAHTQDSRALVDSVIATQIFPSSREFTRDKTLNQQIKQGKLDVGIIIPADFARDLDKSGSAKVQVIVDGADAYTAGIASAYALRTIGHFQPQGISGVIAGRALMSDPSSRKALLAALKPPSGASMGAQSAPPKIPSFGPTTSMSQLAKLIDPKVVFLYNPGLLASWFFVPGVLGAALTLTSTLVASATVLRERERGTMEQLLMTPADDWEIMLAKVLPLVAFLLADVCFAIISTRILFNVPFAGSIVLFLVASTFYVFVGIGLGMLLGTICTSQRQAQLASFFMNIPLILLSGSVVPFYSMPKVLRTLSEFDPLKYYVTVSRSVILKGVPLSVVWGDVVLLALFALFVLAVSVNLFRRRVA